MKTKKFVMLIAAVTLIAVITGCSSAPAAFVSGNRSANAALSGRPIRTEPAARPDWVDNIPDGTVNLSIVGTSRRIATTADARRDAQEDGRQQLVDYFGTAMVNQARTYTGTFGIASDTLSPQIAAQGLQERVAQGVAQALAARNYFTEVYLDSSTNREAYVVYVLMEVSKEQVRRTIDNYGQEQAADYARRAAAEQDTRRRQQLEQAAEFFGGNLSSKLGF